MELIPSIKQIRVETGQQGTFGIWLINGKYFCNTLELPWRMNTTYVSCIPTGQYIMKRYNSSRHKLCYQLQDVYGRSGINIHSASFVSHLEGCIAIGSSIRKLQGKRALLNSGTTMREFMKMMKGHDEIRLTITENY